MDKFNDLLASRDFTEPEDVVRIKDFVQKKFNCQVDVRLVKNQIYINTDSAALASQLRNEIMSIQELINSDKRIVIYIS